MNEPIKISAKNLGTLALKDYCPRCFYLKLKMGFKIPYQIFPGIFSTIDSYSKKITWSHFAKYDKAPEWFEKIGKCRRVIPVPHHSKFFYVDSQTGIRLTGIPDEIIELEDGTYAIIDYKTSRYTNTQDQLLPVYKVQLNGYAYIFEKLGMGKVSGIYLLYYEPQGDAPLEENLDKLIRQDGFVMPFKAHLKKLELNPDGLVMPLMDQVRTIWDRKQVLAAKEGCRDCQMLGEMMNLI